MGFHMLCCEDCGLRKVSDLVVLPVIMFSQLTIALHQNVCRDAPPAVLQMGTNGGFSSCPVLKLQGLSVGINGCTNPAWKPMIAHLFCGSCSANNYQECNVPLWTLNYQATANLFVAKDTQCNYPAVRKIILAKQMSGAVLDDMVRACTATQCTSLGPFETSNLYAVKLVVRQYYRDFWGTPSNFNPPSVSTCSTMYDGSKPMTLGVMVIPKQMMTIDTNANTFTIKTEIARIGQTIATFGRRETSTST